MSFSCLSESLYIFFMHRMEYQRALKAFNNYCKSLYQIQLRQRKFSFSHHEAFGLTKEEFHDLMDFYKVPKCKQDGSKGLSISVPYAEKEGDIKKTIFLFTAPRKNKYDALVAEVSSPIVFSWRG